MGRVKRVERTKDVSNLLIYSFSLLYTCYKHVLLVRSVCLSKCAFIEKSSHRDSPLTCKKKQFCSDFSCPIDVSHGDHGCVH